jgi:hypothetical protein
VVEQKSVKGKFNILKAYLKEKQINTSARVNHQGRQMTPFTTASILLKNHLKNTDISQMLVIL